MPQAHGNASKSHGEVFAEGGRRRTADGSHGHSKGRVCRVPLFGHTANTFAMCFSRYTATKTKRRHGIELTASGVIHRVSTGAAHGKTGMGARRPRGSTVCFGLCHTAKSRASPCAMAAARGEARPWHMAN